MPWRQFGKHYLDDETIDHIYDMQKEPPCTHLIVYRKGGGVMHIQDELSAYAFTAWSAEKEAQDKQQAQEAQRTRDAYTKANRKHWEKEAAADEQAVRTVHDALESLEGQWARTILRGMDIMHESLTPESMRKKRWAILDKVGAVLRERRDDPLRWAITMARIQEAIS